MREHLYTTDEMSQTLDGLPPEYADQAIGCAYTNHSGAIQIVRISNVENWYFERVVFPAQMIGFTATTHATLDVYTCDHAGALLDERIPCSRLALADSISKEVSRVAAEQ